MLVKDVINITLHYLKEDTENPEFWSQNIVKTYLVAGIRNFLNNTNFQINDRRLPLAINAKGNSFHEGFFKIPYDEVQQIKKVYWVNDEEDFSELDILSVKQMDRQKGVNWRKTDNKGTPSTAVLFGGETGEWSLDDNGFPIPSRAGAKLRLYPIPEYTDSEIQTLTAIADNFSSLDVPYFVDEEYNVVDDITGDVNTTVNSRSIDGDPTLENNEVVVNIDSNTDVAKLKKTPWILYRPNFSASEMWDTMDLPFPEDIATALADFAAFKCYKEGGFAEDGARAGSHYRAYKSVEKQYQKHDFFERDPSKRGNPLMTNRKKWG